MKREEKIDKFEGESLSRYTHLPRIQITPFPTDIFHALPPPSIIIILQIQSPRQRISVELARSLVYADSHGRDQRISLRGLARRRRLNGIEEAMRRRPRHIDALSGRILLGREVGGVQRGDVKSLLPSMGGLTEDKRARDSGKNGDASRRVERVLC